ncbi:MAG: DUF1259 domain-containing protein [Alphaproteobacteria bacterium]|nr:DUF1259 domain-containing protein [Alphaproteobacteria bacterium]
MDKIFLLFLFFLIVENRIAYGGPPFDIGQIENLTKAKGELDIKSGVYKITLPHENLKVNAIGVTLTPALGLTSWASFKSIGSETEVMGDMALLEDQVNPVMKVILDNGLNVTALHNHYLWETPKLMFMHIEGRGNLKALATAVGKVFEAMKKTSKGSAWLLSPPPLQAKKSTFDPNNIAVILDKKGAYKEGVYKVTWEKITQMHGQEMGASLGINSWAAFAGTNKQAVVLGDIAMKEDEVQNVLKTLLKHNLFVTSLHQHMIEEQPRIMFVHYIGRGPLMDLTKAIKEVVNQTQLSVPSNTEILKNMHTPESTEAMKRLLPTSHTQ